MKVSQKEISSISDLDYHGDVRKECQLQTGIHSHRIRYKRMATPSASLLPFRAIIAYLLPEKWDRRMYLPGMCGDEGGHVGRGTSAV